MITPLLSRTINFRYMSTLTKTLYKFITTLLATCFHAGFLLTLFFDPKIGADIYISSKRRLTVNGQHEVISHKMIRFVTTAVRTSILHYLPRVETVVSLIAGKHTGYLSHCSFAHCEVFIPNCIHRARWYAPIDVAYSSTHARVPSVTSSSTLVTLLRARLLCILGLLSY
jgi:hypothetical protein